MTFSGPVNAQWEFGPGSSLSGSGPIGVTSQGSLRLKTENSSCTGDITVEDASLDVESPGSLSANQLTTAPGALGKLILSGSSAEPLPLPATPFITSTRFCSPSFPVLAAGSTYWIVCEPVVAAAAAGQRADYRWYLNQTPGRTVLFKQQSAFGDNLPADPWPLSSTAANLALKIETLPVP